MGRVVLITWLLVAFRLIRKDMAVRDGVSKAIWIPTLWAFIQMSRPLSTWLGGFGAGDDYMEGSPLDRLFWFGLIALALAVLLRRQVNWSQVFRNSWPILLFYAYLLLSVTWAPDSFVSLKRWVKEFGNVFVALVILTEANPQQAFRAVYVRCAYVLLPLSIIFLRWFPDLGRRYMRGGAMEVVGVTDQKNSLGILVVVCGLVLIWDWLERNPPGIRVAKGRVERFLPVAFFLIGAYLLYVCDSKTSILCLALGGIIVASPRISFLQARARILGFGILALFVAFSTLDFLGDMKADVLGLLGRDATFTGRTDVWRELLALNTPALLGTGFCSFWSDQSYLSRLPDWVAKSAHNGYLETYLDGGYVGVFFLALMLIAIAFRLNRRLNSNYTLIRFAVFIALVIGSFSESHIGRMSPLAFIFLLVSFNPLREQPDVVRDGERTSHPAVSGMPREVQPAGFKS